MQLFKTDSIISVLDRLLMIVICSFLLWGHVTDTPFKIKWFVFAQTAAYSITAAISFFLVMVHTGKIHFKFEPQFSLAILKKSYPYAILILLMGLYNVLFGYAGTVVTRWEPSGWNICPGISNSGRGQYVCFAICQFAIAHCFRAC
jgi:hypothetical protein